MFASPWVLGLLAVMVGIHVLAFLLWCGLYWGAALSALVVLFVIDWRQTLAIARHPDRWYERNPFLGEHPSVRAVHVWFACCALAGIAVGYVFLEAPAALAVLVGIALLAEAVCVVNNFRLGIRPDMKGE